MITYKASVKKQGTANSTGTSSAIDTTTSDFLVAVVCSYNLVAPATISDSQSNSWSSVASIDDGTEITVIYITIPGANVSASHTFSAGGTATYASICVGAYSGVKQTSPTDQTNSGTVSNTVVQPGTQSGDDTGGITPSEDNCLLIYAGTGNWETSLSASSGTARQTAPIDLGNSFAGSLFDEIQTTAIARNPRLTTGGGSHRISGIIASFKAAAAGGIALSRIIPQTSGLIIGGFVG